MHPRACKRHVNCFSRKVWRVRAVRRPRRPIRGKRARSATGCLGLPSLLECAA